MVGAIVLYTIGYQFESDQKYMEKDYKSVAFKCWRESCQYIWMQVWERNKHLNVIYDPWIKTEYEAFEKGITPEEFVQKNYIDVYVKK